MQFFPSSKETLAVIGAGPKGIAVAIKSLVLREFGIDCPQVILIEKNEVASHWSGNFGYTDGRMKLGTSPEKDLVYPLVTDVGDPAINQKIRSRLMEFTWAYFLMESGDYSDWVDRGRPAPCHSEWANYLRWAFSRIAAQTDLIIGEVKGISLSGDIGIDGKPSWMLDIKSKDNSRSLQVSRLLMTGPGEVRTDFEIQVGETRAGDIYDLDSFWRQFGSNQFQLKKRIAIVGAGENSASLLLALAGKLENSSSEITLISPTGFISTRAENFYENRFYSQPDKAGWDRLAISDRQNFIQRTDLGVFSVQAMQLLNEQRTHQILAGKVTKLKNNSEKGIDLEIEYNGVSNILTADQVILATGFDSAHGFRKLLSERTRKILESRLGASLDSHQLSPLVQKDLSIQNSDSEAKIPKLHLPMLAGLSQGPGFANLSSLGLLSDRILL